LESQHQWKEDLPLERNKVGELFFYVDVERAPGCTVVCLTSRTVSLAPGEPSFPSYLRELEAWTKTLDTLSIITGYPNKGSFLDRYLTGTLPFGYFLWLSHDFSILRAARRSQGEKN
jgi:hypothetical protein